MTPPPAPQTPLTDTVAFLVQPLDPGVLVRARVEGTGCDGRPAVPWTAEGGEPVRCCLRDAAPGDALLLVAHEPALPAASPYQERGAVFVHAGTCAGPADVGTYPHDWLGRPQVLRAYDERGWIHPATTVHDGVDPTGALAAVLRQPGVVLVHSRNVAYGCFMFAVRPCGAPSGAPS